MESYELAFRMQAEVPGLLDLSKEDAKTQALYGIGEEPTDAFGRRCLLARRLVEQGVRFVQLYAGTWDSHDYIEKAHGNLVQAGRQADRRADRRPEADRAARHDAGGLVRRVRPLAGQRRADGHGVRPRPQPEGDDDLVRRRRREGRAHDRRDRRDSAPRRSSASTTSATCTSRCCSCSAWTTRS